MTNIDAIKYADDMRPNAVPDEIKNGWLMTLEAEFYETMGEEFEPTVFPDEAELIMPSPYNQAYPLYLATMIDMYNQDMALYQNDFAISNQSVSEAKAWWRRHNRYPEVTEIKL